MTMAQMQAEAGPPIRDAASLVVLRRGAPDAVLMGQRGAQAVFLPSKVVFPGGAVDPGDAAVALAEGPGPVCRARLEQHAAPGCGPALVAAAIRELWEETGLMLGVPGAWPAPPPPGWAGFAAAGLVPSAVGLHFIFRAITPPGRPRRFDARFFMVEAEALHGNPDDFSRAQDELSHLRWVPLPEMRAANLPFITEVVLAEVAALAARGLPPASVPFFRNDAAISEFVRL